MNYYIILFLIIQFFYSRKPETHDVGITTTKPNVLFICVDDLRPDLGCYGNTLIKSPHIDKLASEGCIFTNQFVQVPTCGASRFSMLTGMLPTRKIQLSNEAIRELISDAPKTNDPETFIDHLRRNGYYTVGIGKISHYADGLVYGYEEQPSDKRELPYSWDELVFNPGKWGTGWNAFFGYANGENRQSMNRQVKPYEEGDVDDEGYVDGLTAELAIKKLDELAKKDQPFFLGVGFFKPHLPFNSPGKYWDLYDESTIPLTPSPNIPENVNPASLHNSGEFNGYQAGDEKPSLTHPLSDGYSRKIRYAYFAAISYSDAQVGKVLDELDKLGLSDNTIVVIWGDHGWQLGDHRVWGKHTIFERALRSVLIIKAPNIQQKAIRCDHIVSAVDIYPTIVDLCGLKMPHKTDGTSLIPLINDPKTKAWDDVTYGYYKNGISMRDERYRLTKYFRDAQPVIELYDHDSDPNENRNVAAQHPDIVKQLMPLWQKGNTGLYQSKN